MNGISIATRDRLHDARNVVRGIAGTLYLFGVSGEFEAEERDALRLLMSAAERAAVELDAVADAMDPRPANDLEEGAAMADE